MGFFHLLLYNFTQFAPMEGTSTFFMIYLFDETRKTIFSNSIFMCFSYSFCDKH